MAEAFPLEDPDRHENIISVLILAVKWQFDTYGLSTINKSLVNNLRLVDPDAKTIKITCAVVEEEGKIKDADVKDAEKDGVVLKGAKRPMRRKKQSKPSLEWLDEYPGTYYRYFQDHNFDFIIGHAPFLANGCFNLKDIYKETDQTPKIILMFHALPKDEDGDLDDETLMEWLTKADVVFSVGKAVADELVPFLAGINEENSPSHKVYIPSYPVELFHIQGSGAWPCAGLSLLKV